MPRGTQLVSGNGSGSTLSVSQGGKESQKKIRDVLPVELAGSSEKSSVKSGFSFTCNIIKNFKNAVVGEGHLQKNSPAGAGHVAQRALRCSDCGE